MTAFLLAIALALAPSVENEAGGHELRVPSGWHAYVREGVTIVASRGLGRPQGAPFQVRLRPGDVYLWLDQSPTKAYAGTERARPAWFASLPPAQSYDCGFGEGHKLLWRERGVHVHAFVRLGPRTSPAAALAVLNTVRITQ